MLFIIYPKKFDINSKKNVDIIINNKYSYFVYKKGTEEDLIFFFVNFFFLFFFWYFFIFY